MAPIKGAAEFLLACGFEDKVLSVEGTITNSGQRIMFLQILILWIAFVHWSRIQFIDRCPLTGEWEGENFPGLEFDL